MEEPKRSSVATLRPDLPELLKGVPVLSGLPAELRSAIAERATITTLPAGEWLFHQGEVGDVMYVVLSGRVEVVLEQPDGEVVRVLGRGGVVGELAILTEAPRSAGVRARRDTELLALDRARFVELLTEEARFAMSLTRELGMRLRASRSLDPPRSDRPATIALVPLVGRRRFEEIGDALREALERCAPIAQLTRSDDAASYGPMLDRAERDSERVLLPTGSASDADEWTAFCLRQSDRTIVVAEESASRVHVPKALRGADLLLLASSNRPPEAGPLRRGAQSPHDPRGAAGSELPRRRREDGPPAFGLLHRARALGRRRTGFLSHRRPAGVARSRAPDRPRGRVQHGRLRRRDARNRDGTCRDA